MSEEKRKRRSFWEPDSPTIKAWLDAQTDLGTSLQLIIVDALHKYGEGDVIRAHLHQREQMRPIAPAPIEVPTETYQALPKETPSQSHVGPIEVSLPSNTPNIEPPVQTVETVVHETPIAPPVQSSIAEPSAHEPIVSKPIVPIKAERVPFTPPTNEPPFDPLESVIADARNQQPAPTVQPQQDVPTVQPEQAEPTVQPTQTVPTAPLNDGFDPIESVVADAIAVQPTGTTQSNPPQTKDGVSLLFGQNSRLHE